MDAISTGYVSAALRLRHASRADGFTLVSVLTSSRSTALHICSVQLLQSRILQNRYTGLLYLADVGARRSNSAEFSTEQTGSQAQKQQYNIWLLFKIKHSVLTPAHKSQKRDKHKFFCPPVGNTSCCCFYKLKIQLVEKTGSEP